MAAIDRKDGYDATELRSGRGRERHRKIGGSPETRKHLENLGFVVGGKVKVVQTIGGNLIVNVKESRVACLQRDGRPDHDMRR